MGKRLVFDPHTGELIGEAPLAGCPPPQSRPALRTPPARSSGPTSSARTPQPASHAGTQPRPRRLARVLGLLLVLGALAYYDRANLIPPAREWTRAGTILLRGYLEQWRAR